MRTFFAGFVAVMCLLLCGCYSMNTASTPRFHDYRMTGCQGSPMEHVCVFNYGWYLFNTCPIVCGNAKRDRSWPFALFSDHVTPEIIQSRLTDRAREINADVADLVFTYNATCMLPIPYVNTTFGILWYKEMQISGVLVKSSSADATKRRPIDPLRNDMDHLLKSIPDGGVK